MSTEHFVTHRNLLMATFAEYERELITERVNAGIAAARQSGTRFGRPPVDPAVIAEKLDIDIDLAFTESMSTIRTGLHETIARTDTTDPSP